MSGSLVADLGVGPEVWLFLTLLGCVTLFFKFSRVWSVRNLDLLLLFALAPGMMLLVGHEASPALGRVRLAVPRLGALAGPLPDRPGPDAPAAAGAEPERGGPGLPVDRRARAARRRDGQPAGRRRGRAEPGRPRRRAAAAAARGHARSANAPRPSTQVLESPPCPAP